MKIPLTPTDLIDQLRSWFHPKDRSITVATDCFIDMDEQATPGTPTPGRRRIYPKDAGWYDLDDAGIETQLGGGGGAHNILSATHSDSVGATACVAGDLLYGNATPKWDRLAKGTAYQVLAMNAGATAPAWGGIAIGGAQPVFSALKTDAANTNVTGDGTIYAYICNTEIFDVGANYNAATGVFSAPVTAKYLLVAGVYASDIGVNHTAFEFRMITSNRNYNLSYENSTRVADAGYLIRSGMILADMDSGDTAHPDIIIYGSTKTCDINGNAATFYTYFQGYMLI